MIAGMCTPKKAIPFVLSASRATSPLTHQILRIQRPKASKTRSTSTNCGIFTNGAKIVIRLALFLYFSVLYGCTLDINI